METKTNATQNMTEEQLKQFKRVNPRPEDSAASGK